MTGAANLTGTARRLVVVGSTGSIGRQALDVVRRHPDRFAVEGLVAGRDATLLATQVAEFGPRYCGLADAGVVGVSDNSAGLEQASPTVAWDQDVGLTVARDQDASLTVFRGQDAGWQVVAAAKADLVVDAVAGIEGLWPAFAGLRTGATVAMASKEPMVAAGDLLREHAAAVGARVYPIDSETTAVAQCLAHVPVAEVSQVYVTASGGPLWGRDPLSFGSVKPEEAVRHPRWTMGRKISVDSATMFNKGLEVIEISRFFELPLDRIAILVHPQSVAHALVEFCDGSIMAQLGPTDMRVSIAQAMFWPDRPPGSPVRLAMDGQRLEFGRPDLGPWPCLRAALTAAAEGGTAPAAVSAADEVLVSCFLSGAIGFNDLGCGLWATLAAHRSLQQAALCGGVRVGALPALTGTTPVLAERVAAVSRIDAWARQFAAAWAVEDGGHAAHLDPHQIGEDYRG